MALVVPKEGTFYAANALITPFVSSVTLRLFTDNITPDHNTVFTDLHEPSFGGYAPQSVAFNPPLLPQVDGSTILQLQPITFSNSGGTSADIAYGYFLAGIDAFFNPIIIWVERKSPSVDWSIPGQMLVVSPQISVASLFG